MTTSPARDVLLADALRAYALQTYPHRRLIIVNDGRPLRSLREDVRVINIEAGSMSLGARSNLAVTTCGTPWFACWDDDDFSLPETLSVLLETAFRTDAVVVRPTKAFLAGPDLRPVEVFRDTLNGAGLFRTQPVLSVGGYGDLRYGYDIQLMLRLAAAGTKTARSQAVTYVHRRHGRNVSGTANNLARLDVRFEEAKANRERWPDPQMEALWKRICDLRATPIPRLVEPS